MTAPRPELAALRRRLAEVVGEPRLEAAGLATGLAALDRLLPGGGVPRGRLTELVGPRSGGRTTLVRELARTTLRGGGWVAYVDATRTLDPREWADVATEAAAHALLADRPPRLRVVRPPDPGRGAWCADVLLRSGAFALVVLDGVPLAGAVAVRLARLARDADAALVVLGPDEGRDERPGARLGAVRVRVRRSWGVGRGGSGVERPTRTGRRRTLHVTVEKGGSSHRAVEVSCAIGVARRLCAHPEVPDRRGVAAGGHGRGGRAQGAGGRAAGAGGGSRAAGRGPRAGSGGAGGPPRFP